ncbi:MAG: acyltransferase [Myxococcaceae bacterium]
MKLPDLEKVKAAWRAETLGLNPRHHALVLAAVFLPRRSATLLRLAGARIGAGTLVLGLPRMNGQGNFLSNLTVGANCVLDEHCSFDLEDRITLGSRVKAEREAMVLTSTHELGPHEHRAGPVLRKPVVVEDDVKLGARCILLPGITVGAGAIVDPHAVVTQDVPPNTRVGGIPAVRMGP